MVFSLDVLMKYTREQIEALSGHNVLLVGLLYAIVRYEPSNSDDQKGEICVGGIRYATHLDKNGLPLIYKCVKDAIIKNIVRIIENKEKSSGYEPLSDEFMKKFMDNGKGYKG